MPTTATTVPVRVVVLPDRIDYHAAACACRVPKAATVSHRDMDAADLADCYAEAVELNDAQPVKPCLRRALGLR